MLSFQYTRTQTMFLYFIGGLTTLYLIIKVQLRLWRNFYTYILPKFLDNGPHLRSMGKWAVITGCTTGIGKEYAMKLAECGLHTVLISRSEDKLRAVSLEIEERYNVKTKIVVADFLQGDHIYDHIRAELFNLDIGILVNNVGIRTPGRKNFLEAPQLDKVVTDLVTVNVLSVPKMTSIVLPGMVKRQRGIVINVSSFVGRFQCKQFCLYGATKAFVCFFTKCLQKEYGENGIIFQNLTPWVISSQMTDYMPTSRILPDAKTYVDSSFRTIGYSDDTCGYLPHDIMAFIFSSRLAYLVSGFWLCLMAGKAKWQRIKTVYNWQ